MEEEERGRNQVSIRDSRTKLGQDNIAISATTNLYPDTPRRACCFAHNANTFCFKSLCKMDAQRSFSKQASALRNIPSINDFNTLTNREDLETQASPVGLSVAPGAWRAQRPLTST